MEDGLEGAADKLFNAPITPVQISKKAERAMHREKMVGAGKQYAPTLYTVLVNAQDDKRLFGYYPTLAGETETYLSAKAAEEGFLMDGQPLVRFIVDEGLRRGKFDIVAELVSAPIIAQLRQEELRRYGLATGRGAAPAEQGHVVDNQAARASAEKRPSSPLPFVPEDEIDRSINYGEYTFNSQDWNSYQQNGLSMQPLPGNAPAFGDEDPATPSELNQALTLDSPEAIEAEPGFDIARSREDDQQDASAQDEADAAAPINPRDSLDLLPEIESDLSGFDVDSYQPLGAESHKSDSLAFISEHELRHARGIHSGAGSGNRRGAAMPHKGMVEARLLNNAGTQAIDLVSHRLIMGRSSSCDIMIDDINASRNHAELRKELDGEWIICDLGSTNGTFVNGRRVTTRTLYEGDRIRIGMNDFVFSQK